MQFSHHPEIWARFPELAASTLFAEGIHTNFSVAAQVARFNAIATSRLDAAGAESELPEIKAWRGVFSRMGLKPTQYRCASESLLRRFRKEGSLPPIHPLIDLCNAASLAFAIQWQRWTSPKSFGRCRCGPPTAPRTTSASPARSNNFP